MDLVLVRHGRTAANADGLLQGHSDRPLDGLGRRQAAALAGAIGPVEHIVSSPLRRATETAAAIGTVGELDDRWIELDYGDFEGRAVSEVEPEDWARWRADPSYRPPGGETLAELGARVRAALDDLARSARHGRIVIVSHVSPIKAAVAWALGVGDAIAWRCRLDPASITRIALGANGPALRGFNDVGHLRGLDA